MVRIMQTDRREIQVAGMMPVLTIWCLVVGLVHCNRAECPCHVRVVAPLVSIFGFPSLAGAIVNYE